MLASIAGCAGPDDGCDVLCVAAEEKFSSCLEENGTEWGTSVGFTSPADFQDWCATYTWEERELGRGELCDDRREVIEAGDCAAWYAAWGDTL